MKYYPIPEALIPYVQSIWSFQSPDHLEVNEQAIVIPSGRWLLLWNYKGTYSHIVQNKTFQHPLYDLHLVSQHNSKIGLHGTEPVNSIGISFKPYGYYAIAGPELPTLINTVDSISKKNLSGQEVLSTFSGNLQEAVEELCSLIIQRLCYIPDERVVSLVNEIDQCKGNILIKDLFEKAAGSQRYLNKLFKSQVGITPKDYASIIRFQEIYNRFIRGRDIDHKDDIYDFYYDESHFIHNFRKILLTHPHLFMKNPNFLGNQFIKK